MSVSFFIVSENLVIQNKESSKSQPILIRIRLSRCIFNFANHLEIYVPIVYLQNILRITEIVGPTKIFNTLKVIEFINIFNQIR